MKYGANQGYITHSIPYYNMINLNINPSGNDCNCRYKGESVIKIFIEISRIDLITGVATRIDPITIRVITRVTTLQARVAIQRAGLQTSL